MVKHTVTAIGLGLLFGGLLVQAQSPAPQTAPKPATQAAAKDDGSGMVLVPAGEFWMGRTHMFLFDELNWTALARLDDQPARPVDVDAFYLDKYELTNSEYAKFIQATGHRKPWYWKDGKVNPGQEKWPVYDVSWDDAVAYCAWAGKRLPTEAEWEKADRGGLDRKLYSWGDELDPEVSAGEGKPPAKKKMAHIEGTEGPMNVGSFPPNGYGLYDMTGNVWEWASDWYSRDYYAWGPSKNPKGPDTGEYRVMRGGGWSNNEEPFRNGQRSLIGAHYRNYAPPSQISDAVGFRCAKDAK